MSADTVRSRNAVSKRAAKVRQIAFRPLIGEATATIGGGSTFHSVLILPI